MDVGIGTRQLSMKLDKWIARMILCINQNEDNHEKIVKIMIILLENQLFWWFWALKLDQKINENAMEKS